jgi:hypothetical protein
VLKCVWEYRHADGRFIAAQKPALHRLRVMMARRLGRRAKEKGPAD